MTSVVDIPLAITGMACRLPGAESLDEYWQLLAGGKSRLGELPPERFNSELYYHPEKGRRTKSYTKLGGYVADRPFDRQSCPLPASLIEESHEVHLKLCEVAATACRHAGYDPFALPTRRVGVYVGHTPPSALSGEVTFARQVAHTTEYLREIPGIDKLLAGRTGEVIGEIVRSYRDEYPPGSPELTRCANSYHSAALITRAFELDGPSMAFDAACASSLRALGHAARALQLGQVEMAIVGGASFVSSDCLVLFSQAQSVSTCGTRPFDADADGLVASEGYVVLCLKTLQQALADGDCVLSVIRGIGISSDGKGKSLWAPRHEGQIEAIKRAYGPGISLDTLQYIEMHATSTQVGDATEMTALTRVLGEQIRGRKVPVGSVKANVGHTLESAGLASLIKTVLAMNHGVIPPQINVRRLNPTIDWDAVPFYVPLEAQEWPAPAPGRPRRAAVNAFGIGGLNVHVVLDEHLPEVSRALVDSRRTEFHSVRDERLAGLHAANAGASSGVPATGRHSSASDDEPIAIIGTGAILPGARTVEALWDVLRSGQDQTSDVPPERWDPAFACEPGADEPWKVPTCRGGFITGYQYDWKKHKVPPKQVANADPLQFMLLDAAEDALASAGYRDKPFDRTRTGVVVGTIFGGEFGEQLKMGLGLPEFQQRLRRLLCERGVPEPDVERVTREYEDILLKHLPALIDETGSFTASTLASRITKTFDLMGGAVAVDSGDASGLAALSCCVDLLRAGDCDMMVCAAGQRSMGIATYDALARSGLLARRGTAGPFEADADGCVPGEGVGVLVLKRLADAERDGDCTLGIIRGIGAGRGATLREGLERAMGRALDGAGVRPEQVSVVEAASSGVPRWDPQEADAIVSTYGAAQRPEKLRVGAVAAQFGNTGATSGVAALLKGLLELNHVEMTAGAGVERPVSALAGAAAPVELASKSAPLPPLNEDGRLLAGITAYSQVGIAYHLVLEGTTRVTREGGGASVAAGNRPAVLEKQSGDGAPHSKGPRIIRIGATDFASLRRLAGRAAGSTAQTWESAE
ncbi:MAG TPA: polyketide synthase, partial [Planctomycetaceae bacterium]|nr:polyketide synthase [Planctomycetaceae bacterium]